MWTSFPGLRTFSPHFVVVSPIRIFNWSPLRLHILTFFFLFFLGYNQKHHAFGVHFRQAFLLCFYFSTLSMSHIELNFCTLHPPHIVNVFLSSSHLPINHENNVDEVTHAFNRYRYLRERKKSIKLNRREKITWGSTEWYNWHPFAGAA